MTARIRKFFEETRTEFRHLNWPTRGEAMRLTGIVVLLSLALAAFLGAFDSLFTFAIQSLFIR